MVGEGGGLHLNFIPVFPRVDRIVGVIVPPFFREGSNRLVLEEGLIIKRLPGVGVIVAICVYAGLYLTIFIGLSHVGRHWLIEEVQGYVTGEVLGRVARCDLLGFLLDQVIHE